MHLDNFIVNTLTHAITMIHTKVETGLGHPGHVSYSLHRAMPINLLLLQDSKSATLVVWQGILFYKARAADL